MTPFERKIVHDAVAAAGLTSESEGQEPHRYVVVRPVLTTTPGPRRPPFHVKPRRGTSVGAGPFRGDATPTVERFAGWLAGPGLERGLLGPREAERDLVSAPAQLRRPGALRSAGRRASATWGPGLVCPAWSLALQRPDLSR